ncbi:MAG TPA: glycosyltransferase [Gemmatimonadaceae bacterium]|nr:glycosyltransferase [Gemmatimonadaceae bacterium]
MVSPIVTAPAPELDAGSAPLRVALMLESDGPGGAEVMLLQLAEELRRRGHHVLPVGPDDGCGWLAARFRERGFEPATYSLRRPIDLRCLDQLTRLLRVRRVDVVHSHEFTMAVYGAAAARRTGARHVITMHGGRYFAEQWRRRAALRWAARRSDALVAVSGATAEDLRRVLGLPPHAVRVVPNGIEFRTGSRERVRAELGVGRDELLLVAVGNLYPVKGHMVLLRALAALRDASVARWRLAIAGRGEEEEPLRAFAAREGIADRVHLLGFRSDVPDILAAADAFVMPSLSEGLPLALVEAMSMALPILASDVGGIPEVVARGEEALLSPPGDADALAAALRDLLSHPERRAALGAAARRRALRDFSARTMGDAYERIYRGRAADAAAPAVVGEGA